MNEPSAHATANEIFRKWHDLKLSKMDGQYKFLTVYNSASKAIRVDDIRALEESSEVISYPEQHEALLTAVGADRIYSRRN